MALSAMAGTWKQDNVGWWYDNGNGTYPSSSWQWIDGNNDGTAECYYFDRTGYMMANTTTPDNYQVNASGAWVQNGTVQTRNVKANGQSKVQIALSTTYGYGFNVVLKSGRFEE